MAATRTYYRPGLLFKAHAKSLGHQECCRPQAQAVYTPDGTGLVREEIPALWAEFGVYGGEVTYTDPLTGSAEIGSEFRGGYFDLDAQAAEKGWTAGEKEIVARHMLRLIETKPGAAQFSLYSKAPAAKPWPTIDTTHPKQVPALAEQLGLLVEALAWVEENKPQWGEAVEKLRELIAASQQDAVLEESLTAA